MINPLETPSKSTFFEHFFYRFKKKTMRGMKYFLIVAAARQKK